MGDPNQKRDEGERLDAGQRDQALDLAPDTQQETVADVGGSSGGNAQAEALGGETGQRTEETGGNASTEGLNPSMTPFGGDGAAPDAGEGVSRSNHLSDHYGGGDGAGAYAGGDGGAGELSASSTPFGGDGVEYMPIDSGIASQFKRTTDIDVSGILIGVNPSLEEEGAKGVAIEGVKVEVVAGHEKDIELIAHELGHIGQQQGGSPGQEVEEGAEQALEVEADEVAQAVMAGEIRQIVLKSARKRLYQDGRDVPAQSDDELRTEQILLGSQKTIDWETITDEAVGQEVVGVLNRSGAWSALAQKYAIPTASIAGKMKVLSFEEFDLALRDMTERNLRTDKAFMDEIRRSATGERTTEEVESIIAEIVEGSNRDNPTLGGYYDRGADVCYINASSGLGGRLVTAIHEAIHSVSSPVFLDTLGKSANEGMTEYFTYEVIRELGVSDALQVPVDYASFVTLMQMSMDYMGTDRLAKAYFTGDFSDVRGFFTDRTFDNPYGITGEDLYEAWCTANQHKYRDVLHLVFLQEYAFEHNHPNMLQLIEVSRSIATKVEWFVELIVLLDQINEATQQLENIARRIQSEQGQMADVIGEAIGQIILHLSEMLMLVPSIVDLGSSQKRRSVALKRLLVKARLIGQRLQDVKDAEARRAAKVDGVPGAGPHKVGARVGLNEQLQKQVQVITELRPQLEAHLQAASPGW